MPKIGEKADEDDFTGSVSGLSDRFRDKMIEFITNLLNPENLKPKVIDNNVITAGEMGQYLKIYVDIFNSDELPKPTDMIEATVKAYDINLIMKIEV
jgi:hypothetical protein